MNLQFAIASSAWKSLSLPPSYVCICVRENNMTVESSNKFISLTYESI